MLMIKSLEKLSIFNKEKMSKVVAKKAVILIPNMKKKTKTRRMKNSVCACVWNSNACVIFFQPFPLTYTTFFPLIKRNASAWCRTTLKHKKRTVFQLKKVSIRNVIPPPFLSPKKIWFPGKTRFSKVWKLLCTHVWHFPLFSKEVRGIPNPPISSGLQHGTENWCSSSLSSFLDTSQLHSGQKNRRAHLPLFSPLRFENPLISPLLSSQPTDRQ